MDHLQAIHLQAAERYFLDELDERQHEEFEEHFFSCPECAEDVRSMAAVLAGAAAVATPRAGTGPSPLAAPPARRRPRDRAVLWALAGSVAALLVLALYQGLAVIPRLEHEAREAAALRAVPSYFLALSRSDPPTVAVAPSDRYVALVLSQSSDPHARYRCALRDGAGRTLLTAVLEAQAPDEELQLLLPLRGLSPGPYVLALEGLTPPTGVTAGPVALYPFTLHHREAP